MSERHRIGTFSSGGRFVSLLDVNDGVNIRPRAFHVVPYRESAAYGAATRRYQGSTQASEVHDNGQLEVVWILRDSTADAVLDRWEGLVELLESARTDLFYEWRPGAATRSVYFRLRGGVPWDVDYEWWKFNADILELSAGFVIAPLAYGDPMDIVDDFSVDSIADYTFDSGDGTLSVSGGQLVPSSTAEKRLYHSGRGYTYNDGRFALKFTIGASNAGWAAVTFKRLDANNYLFAEVSGGSGGVVVKKVDGGVESTLQSQAGSALSVSTSYWIVGRIESNVAVAELWSSEPTPLGTPTLTATHTLSGADATKFGDGVKGNAGLRITPAATDWRYDDFRVEPYTFIRNGSTPIGGHTFKITGVPGTAPAEVATDLTFTQDVAGAVAGFVAPDSTGVENFVWNGDFEEYEQATDGWAVSAVAGVIGAATSISRQAAAGKFGTASGQVATPATSDVGPSFVLYRRFRKGVTYTASLWARQTAGTANNGRVKLGVSGDIATQTYTGVTGTFAQFSVTWTPSADTDLAYIAFGQQNATTATYQIDGVMVYEGTTAPTGRQAEGAGALLPIGVLDAEAGMVEPLGNTNVGNTPTSSTEASLGNVVRQASAAPGTIYEWGWFVDPSLLKPDDFAGNYISIDYYAKIIVPTDWDGAKLIISAAPRTSKIDSGGSGSFLNTRIYSEFGSSGRPLPAIAQNPSVNFIRLGSIAFPVDTINRRRWELIFGINGPAGGSTGNVDLDFVFGVPSRRRWSSITTNDAFNEFATVAAEATKRVSHDLTATIREYKGNNDPIAVMPVAGAVQVLEPGTNLAVVRASSQTIDGETSTAANDETIPTAVHFSVWPRFHLARAA